MLKTLILFVPDPPSGGGGATATAKPEDPKVIDDLKKQIASLQGQLGTANTLNTTLKNRVDELTGILTKAAEENKTLNNTIDAMQRKDAQRLEDEKAIIEKMVKGLSRQQAIAVIERQKKFDAEKTKPESAPKK